MTCCVGDSDHLVLNHKGAFYLKRRIKSHLNGSKICSLAWNQLVLVVSLSCVFNAVTPQEDLATPPFAFFQWTFLERACIEKRNQTLFADYEVL